MISVCPNDSFLPFLKLWWKTPWLREVNLICLTRSRMSWIRCSTLTLIDIPLAFWSEIIQVFNQHGTVSNVSRSVVEKVIIPPNLERCDWNRDSRAVQCRWNIIEHSSTFCIYHCYRNLWKVNPLCPSLQKFPGLGILPSSAVNFIWVETQSSYVCLQKSLSFKTVAISLSKAVCA